VDTEKFGHQECKFARNLLKIHENVFSKQVLDFVSLYVKYYQKSLKSQKSVEPIANRPEKSRSMPF
jgi:hypothetical protein